MYTFPVPPLTIGWAHFLTVSFAFSYVGSLYVSKHARLRFAATTPGADGGERAKKTDEQWRDDPRVIKARLVAVTISTVLSCICVGAVVKHLTPEQDVRCS
jgi:prenyl protein peptidase